MLGANEEDFKAFESKVEKISEILTLLSSDEDAKEQKGIDLADEYLGTDKAYQEKCSKEEFDLKVTQNRTVINNQPESSDQPSQEQSAFMRSIEEDANKRYADRKQRESITQSSLRDGNKAFREKHYEKAINFYNKAIDNTKDNALLFNNRALAYIRFGLYRRAVTDTNVVLGKLDKSNLRAWLTQAKAFHLLGETEEFERCVSEAKKMNPKRLLAIEKAAESIVQESVV